MKNLRNYKFKLGALFIWMNVCILRKLYRSKKRPVIFISEHADWAISTLAKSIKRSLDILVPGVFFISTNPITANAKIIHFGSQYMWVDWCEYLNSESRYIVSFFHGKEEDGLSAEKHIKLFLKSIDKLSGVVTSSGIVESRLLAWGVPRSKVYLIPIGVDVNNFKFSDQENRKLLRRKLGIPENAIVVGSFQKDGIGWGEGMDPKLIKGPDIFLKTISKLKRNYPIFVFLTGPARGYIKNGLDKMNVPYIHSYIEEHKDIAEYYSILDLYLITSREEGGPMALMESMASGVPVVSTNVGMANDLIDDGISGSLVNSFDDELLYQKCKYILSLKKDELQTLKNNARLKVISCDWSVVASRHFNEVYKELLL